MIDFNFSRRAGATQLSIRGGAAEAYKPVPAKTLESAIASGFRVELWDRQASIEGYVSRGCDADALRFHLDDCAPLRTWAGGIDETLPGCPAGSCSMLNYWPRRHWQGAGARMIVFRLPHRAMTQWAQAHDHHRFGGLQFQSGAAFFDPVLANLALAMCRSLDDDGAAAPVFTAMIFEAVLRYVVERFGSTKSEIQRGGLAAWQMRAIERLAATHFDGQVQLSEFARLCRLSVSHFVKAFRATTGITPHQWLIGRRIERARELLRCPTLSLSDVAASCGFADQSHFTRTFSRAAGVSPGAWRKQAAREPIVDRARAGALAYPSRSAIA